MTENNAELSALNRRLDDALKAQNEKIQTEKGQQIGLQRQLEKLERNRDKSLLLCKKAQDALEQAKLIRDKVISTSAVVPGMRRLCHSFHPPVQFAWGSHSIPVWYIS